MKWAQLCSSLNILFIALLCDWNENWPFLVPWPLPRFSNLWTYWVQPLTMSSFRIINSSVGILSPPLALFIVILPKVHLTLHSRMSDSSWVTTASWISRSLVISMYSSSVYSCQLFLISSTSVFYHFWPLSCSSLHELSPWYLQFSWRDLCSFSFYLFPLNLCVVHLRSPSYRAFLWSWKLVIQLCPTLCDPMDCNPPDFSVHGILQARILEPIALLQGIFLSQGSNLCFLHCSQISLPSEPSGFLTIGRFCQYLMLKINPDYSSIHYTWETFKLYQVDVS